MKFCQLLSCSKPIHSYDKRRKYCSWICCGKARFAHVNPRHIRQVVPTPLDIAWAAGIYEGEGHALVANETRSASIGVTQKDEWLLLRLKELFGGSIYRDPMHKRPCSVWCVTGARARGFAMTIFSFLSPRRQTRIKEMLLQGT